MMLVSVVIVTIGSMRARRQASDRDKFRTIAIWYGVALLVILLNIPWPFSPLVSRPWFRVF